MNSKTAGYLIFYGAFLIFMGLLGYLSNPEKAKTALMSGGTFGVLSILWGVARRSRRPVEPARGHGDHRPAVLGLRMAIDQELASGE